MKKIITIIAMVLILTTAAFAANKDITATEAGNFNILYNGAAKGFTDVNGTIVRPIVYEGTTYLPVRAASELVGLSAGWDGATSTITLTQGAGSGCVTAASASIAQRSITATMVPDFTIIYNSAKQTFKDANGTVVYPILKDGTTYLPIRALCNMLSVPVEWDGSTNTIYLGTKPSTPAAPSIQVEGKLLEAVASIDGDGVDPYYAVNTAGYDYLRITASSDVNIWVLPYSADYKSWGNSISSGSISYKKDRTQFCVDVSAYDSVIVCTPYLVAKGAPVLTFTLEKAAEVPAYSIPAGATAITDKNSTLDKCATYSDGKFYVTSNIGLTHTPAAFSLKNSGYTSLTFTVTTQSMRGRVAVYGATTSDDYYIETLPNSYLMTWQDGNTTQTYTLDIASWPSLIIEVANGEASDAIVTNVYVK